MSVCNEFRKGRTLIACAKVKLVQTVSTDRMNCPIVANRGLMEAMKGSIAGTGCYILRNEKVTCHRFESNGRCQLLDGLWRIGRTSRSNHAEAQQRPSQDC